MAEEADVGLVDSVGFVELDEGQIISNKAWKAVVARTRIGMMGRPLCICR